MPRIHLASLLLATSLFSAAAAGADTAASPAPAGASATDTGAGRIKVLLLPSDIKIMNLSATGLEDAPDATAKMTAVTDAELGHWLAGSPEFQLMTMPALSADEQAALKEYLALYKLEAGNAQSADDAGDAWKKVVERFDYSFGPGLQFLKARSGADFALIVFGGDGESTGGHMAMTVMAGLFGVPVAQGRNFLYAGLVDLGTGRITWLNYDHHNGANFTTKNNMVEFVDALLNDFPEASLHGYGDEP
ncbi:MAG: hypothetical protein ACM3ZT_08125 [Bacillota bacterium]